jgi:hypothetical protein
MRLIIAGSRKIDKYRALYEFLNNNPYCDFDSTEFVTGDCPTGPDQVPYLLADIYGLYYQREDGLPCTGQIQIKSFPPDWDKYNKAAGPIRNKQMAEYSDQLLLIWNGDQKTSPGSANIKQQMEKLNKPVIEIIIGES